MSNTDKSCRPENIKRQIRQIEFIMQENALYASEPPNETAFQSTAPFCYDTMSFLEWLQWVMFPKTLALIEKDLPLPTVCEIYPLAEEEFKLIDQNTTVLLSEIRKLDDLFNVCH